MNPKNLSKEFLDDPSFTKKHITEMENTILKAFRSTRSKSLSVLADYAGFSSVEFQFILNNQIHFLEILEAEERRDMRMWFGLVLTLAQIRYSQYEALMIEPEPKLITYQPNSQGLKERIESLFQERADPLITAMNANLRKDLELAMRDGQIKGWNRKKVEDNINLAFDKAEKHAQVVIRTEMMYAFNSYTIERAKLDGYEEMMWITANDERVCPVCGARHLKKFPINDLPEIPAHPSCRCILIPIR